MKRCPVEQGGCGELVDMLFDSGLCQKCDAMVARGTAAVGGPKRRGGRRNGAARVIPVTLGADNKLAPLRPCGKYVKGDKRGICATCRERRAAHIGKPKQRKRRARTGSNGQTNADWLLRERDKYALELTQAEENVIRARFRVEVANEILSELQRAR